MPQFDTAAYPAQYECDVVTRNGSTIHLRPLRADDAAALVTASALGMIA